MDTILCYQRIHESRWIQSYAVNLYMRVDGYNPMLSPILENKWIQPYAINLYMRINGYNPMLSTYN